MGESKKKNVFEKLVDLYEKDLKEADEKGKSELYKKCFENFIDYLKIGFTTKYGQKKPTKFTIVDVEHLDGYFIFASGTNSVVHFHIKELPGWKFGLWFNTDDEYKDTIFAKIFWQYEEYIDKFKPTASNYVFSISFTIKENEIICHSDYMLEKALKFMLDEPALTFCREIFYWTEYEYHSRISARIKKFKFIFLANFNKKLGNILQQYMLKWCKRKLQKKLGVKIYIYTKNPNITPRYALITQIEKDSDIKDRDDLLFEEISEKFNNKYKKLNNLFHRCPDYSAPTHRHVVFLDEDKVKELREKGELK